jgi:N-acetyl sugar amidotransferase
MEKKQVYYGLPEEVKFCKKCVISNQRPSSSVEFKNTNIKKQTIYFDENGVCSACNFSEEKKQIDWNKREKMLFELLEPYRSKNGSYDVIVPSSGGKDSSFASHILKYKYGMNPLTVTWSPNIYTDVGWQNLRNLAETGGVDNILYTPNGRLHKLLTKLAVVNLLHPLQPFIHGQKIIGPRIAQKFKVPLIMYGENQAEYGNLIGENKSPFMKPDFFSIDDPKEMIMGGVKVTDLIKEYGFCYNDFVSYLPLTLKEIETNNIKVSYLGFFEKWDPQECYYYAAENTGFQAAPERSPGTYSKYSEIDDKTIPFHFYTTLIKFGIGRASYDASQEVRNDKITREEAVYLVRKYDMEFPTLFLNDFLTYIGLNENEFISLLDKFRSPHLWKKVNGEWQLRHAVWME